ncbi:putative leucine-rich repeat-containing protein DDB_G0290503 [Hydra vulgaris]|uniref:putative leucine-rich repeat-containing protein DDB_G0290503 n=1 Tax=Hydra vulgaris TaxID=6087 RepID=UPI0032EA81A0
MLREYPKTTVEIDTTNVAGTAPNQTYAQAASKTYAHATTNNININEYGLLKNTLLSKVTRKRSDNEILSAIEDAGYDKYLYGFQQIRNGTMIELVMKNDKIKQTILEKGININGDLHQFFLSTPSRNISKRVTISILGLPIEKCSFPAGIVLEELGYGKHIRTKPIFKQTPKNKTLFYSGKIIVIMDNLTKPIPRFINLKGYEVRAIYTGQKDDGNQKKESKTNQDKVINYTSDPTSDATLVLPLVDNDFNNINLNNKAQKPSISAFEVTSELIQDHTNDELTMEIEDKENEKNENIEEFSKDSRSEAKIENKEAGESKESYDESSSKEYSDESTSDESKPKENEENDDIESEGDDDKIVSIVKNIDESSEIGKESEKDDLRKGNSLNEIEEIFPPTSSKKLKLTPIITNITNNFEIPSTETNNKVNMEQIINKPANVIQIEQMKQNCSVENKPVTRSEHERKEIDVSGVKLPIEFENMTSTEIRYYNLNEFYGFNKNNCSEEDLKIYIRYRRAEYEKEKIERHQGYEEERRARRKAYEEEKLARQKAMKEARPNKDENPKNITNNRDEWNLRLKGYNLRIVYTGQELPENNKNKNETPKTVIPETEETLSSEKENSSGEKKDEANVPLSNEDVSIQTIITTEPEKVAFLNELTPCNTERNNENTNTCSNKEDITTEDLEDGEINIPDELQCLHHLGMVEHNWQMFKNFDRYNCTAEELQKLKIYKKVEWDQFESERSNYRALKNEEKKTGNITPSCFKNMDSGEMYSYNKKEFKNLDDDECSFEEKKKYVAHKKAEWDQRKKEFDLFVEDHEVKQEERRQKFKLNQLKKQKRQRFNE